MDSKLWTVNTCERAKWRDEPTGPRDFSPGLAFVALSRVTKLKGLAIRTACGPACFTRQDTAPSRMLELEEDNIRRCALPVENNFTIETYGVDLSFWENWFY